MKIEKEKPVKAYEFTCRRCNHEWISKIFDYRCPECRETLLDFQKLR